MLCLECRTGMLRMYKTLFRWCLHDFGVELDEEQSGILFDKYDRDCSGLVE